MLRMTRLTDYAVALLAQFVASPGKHSARELATALKLPGPAVSKVLKVLARHGILQTHRGKSGGFTLARPASAISVAEVLRAFEGPLALTDCSSSHEPACCVESCCTVSSAWKRINGALEAALSGITLDEMVDGGGPRLAGVQDAVRATIVPGTLKV